MEAGDGSQGGETEAGSRELNDIIIIFITNVIILILIIIIIIIIIITTGTLEALRKRLGPQVLRSTLVTSPDFPGHSAVLGHPCWNLLALETLRSEPSSSSTCLSRSILLKPMSPVEVCFQDFTAPSSLAELR
ncbi:uncharacterized protein ACOB8E_012539 [Sarcophilus harrisii]